MIAYLSGLLLSKKPPQCVLDVHGVGYSIAVPMTTLYTLPECGEPTALFSHTRVREDAITLYGFSQEHDRHLFETLIKINGVGPKVALAILSGMESHQFIASVQAGDATPLTRIPGIGKKTAERLLLESRDRLKDRMIEGTSSAAGSTQGQQAQDDAISALLALGYKAAAAEKTVAALSTDHHDTESLIRAALKEGVHA